MHHHRRPTLRGEPPTTRSFPAILFAHRAAIPILPRPSTRARALSPAVSPRPLASPSVDARHQAGRHADARDALLQALGDLTREPKPQTETAETEGGSRRSAHSPTDARASVVAALRRVVDATPLAELCDAVSSAVSWAESPRSRANPLAAREGSILIPVRHVSDKMSTRELSRRLRDVVVEREREWRDEATHALAASTTEAKRTRTKTHPGESYAAGGFGVSARWFLAASRGRAYFARGDVAQALADARFAAARAPDPRDVTGTDGGGDSRSESRTRIAAIAASSRAFLADTLEAAATVASARVSSSSPSSSPSLAVSEPPSRVIVRASGERGASETLFADAGVAAAIERRRAMELRPEDASLADAFRDAASRYLPVDLRDVAVDSGADAAVDALDRARWAAAPEYIRPRPKYYHLFEWMRERVEAACPGLPEPVMDKLLAMDADELDLLLKYPRAIRGQAEEFAGVLRDAGAKALETYTTPTMTWEESKALREGRAAGNLADAEKEEEDTDRAALGASGDDGLTREEAAGLPTPISREDVGANASARKSSPKLAARLPPDQLRDARAAAVDARERGASSTTARRTRTFVATAMDDMD